MEDKLRRETEGNSPKRSVIKVEVEFPKHHPPPPPKKKKTKSCLSDG